GARAGVTPDWRDGADSDSPRRRLRSPRDGRGNRPRSAGAADRGARPGCRGGAGPRSRVRRGGPPRLRDTARREGRGMIRFTIRRPVTVAMAYFAVALLGVAAWRNLPIEFLPDTRLPRLTIAATWRGASPETTEAFLTSPLEAVVQQEIGRAH